jgi:hypothetical protein
MCYQFSFFKIYVADGEIKYFYTDKLGRDKLNARRLKKMRLKMKWVANY